MCFREEIAADRAASYCRSQGNTFYAMLFTKLPKLFNRSPKRSWQVPDGQRVYAVGDIHGRGDLLEELIDLIESDDEARGRAETHMIFLGDLVDRGPSSCQVVDRLIDLSASRPNVRFLAGNHDEVFLKAATGNLPALKFLIRIGGRQTIISYGISEDEYRSCDYPGLSDLLVSKVPYAHIEFLSSFEDLIVIGDYLFVHAGIRPGVPLEEQATSDLRWIRDDFLQSRQDHGKLVVHGHSISETVEDRPNRVGIDTGAYASGVLTAIGLQNAQRWFISTPRTETRRSAL